MGIYLYNMAGADSYSTSGTPDPDHMDIGGNNADVFTYTVDVSVGENVVISGDFGDVTSGASGSSFALSGAAPAFGTLVVNSDGTFTYSFNRADVDANGGDQTLSFNVFGIDGVLAATDTDTVQIVITTCFAAGTRIATPEGDRTVESLAIGDTIRTAEGRDVAVKWIGRQTVTTLFGPAERLMPVRIAAGAFGRNLPHTDLTVTADHAMLVGGMLCHAGALVNGTTVARVPVAEMGPQFIVYHIETEEHDIILANGAPAETFIDNVSRRVFDNFAEFEALYGDVPEMVELPLPRAMSVRQLPGHIRRMLAATQAA